MPHRKNVISTIHDHCTNVNFYTTQMFKLYQYFILNTHNVKRGCFEWQLSAITAVISLWLGVTYPLYIQSSSTSMIILEWVGSTVHCPLVLPKWPPPELPHWASKPLFTNPTLSYPQHRWRCWRICQPLNTFHACTWWNIKTLCVDVNNLTCQQVLKIGW